MHFKTVIAASALVATATAQRPSDTPMCDYYTTALLKNNTAANQKVLLTALVNTAVIGTFSIPGVNTTGTVAGILAPGTVNGTNVNLAPYFDGGYASTNTGGSSGTAVNFLDGGGAEPLKQLKPANDTTSNQYILLTHLYEYFGALLGCSMEGQSDFSSYDGDVSQYEVHKFMDLDYAQVTYFVNQVGGAAKSFGVTDADITTVGTALNSLFNVRCAPATTVIPAQGAQLQSICVASDCPLAPNAVCSAYNNGMNQTMPTVANSTLVNSGSSSSSSPSSSATSSEKHSGAGSAFEIGLLAVLGGAAAFMF